MEVIRTGHADYGTPIEATATVEDVMKTAAPGSLTSAALSEVESQSSAAKDREVAAVIAIFAMDIGWVNLMPTLGLPAILGAVALQGAVVADSNGCGHFEFAHNAAIFMWVFANAMWMVSEYIWDEDRPEGFLAYVPSLANLDRSLFPDILNVASVIMWTTCISLMVFYVYALPIASKCRTHFALPLPIYRDLFILPWLVSDSCWILCNRAMALGKDPSQLVTLGTGFGILALVLVADATRRYWVIGKPTEVAHCLAELLWVFGNVAWFVVDMRMEETPEMRNAFCAVFVIGLLLIIALSMSERRMKPKKPVFKTPLSLGAFPGERTYLLQSPAPGADASLLL